MWPVAWLHAARGFLSGDCTLWVNQVFQNFEISNNFPNFCGIFLKFMLLQLVISWMLRNKIINEMWTCNYSFNIAHKDRLFFLNLSLKLVSRFHNWMWVIVTTELWEMCRNCYHMSQEMIQPTPAWIYPNPPWNMSWGCSTVTIKPRRSRPSETCPPLKEIPDEVARRRRFFFLLNPNNRFFRHLWSNTESAPDQIDVMWAWDMSWGA